MGFSERSNNNHKDTAPTSNHFQGQPIYGVVESMKESTGNEMLKAEQQAVQRTEK